MGKKRDDPMDGAHFVGQGNRTPADFMTQEDGKRPNETKEPWGEVHIDLTNGVEGRTIVSKTAWNDGEWQTAALNAVGWDEWVVTGEGSPGNYLRRIYKIPKEEAEKPRPRHPSQWPKTMREGKKYSGSTWSDSKYKGTAPSSVGSGLPWELRIRCVGCGHFFKTGDLADHAKYACAATQEPPVLWVMPCSCHPNDLQVAASVLEGFPTTPPQAAQAAPDTSGEQEQGEPKPEGEMVEDLLQK